MCIETWSLSEFIMQSLSGFFRIGHFSAWKASPRTLRNTWVVYVCMHHTWQCPHLYSIMSSKRLGFPTIHSVSWTLSLTSSQTQKFWKHCFQESDKKTAGLFVKEMCITMRLTCCSQVVQKQNHRNPHHLLPFVPILGKSALIHLVECWNKAFFSQFWSLR